jgi:hypothetical protein
VRDQQRRLGSRAHRSARARLPGGRFLLFLPRRRTVPRGSRAPPQMKRMPKFVWSLVEWNRGGDEARRPEGVYIGLLKAKQGGKSDELRSEASYDDGTGRKHAVCLCLPCRAWLNEQCKKLPLVCWAIHVLV